MKMMLKNVTLGKWECLWFTPRLSGEEKPQQVVAWHNSGPHSGYYRTLVMQGHTGVVIAEVRGKTAEECEENARLIAEAGTVYSATGYTPLQLNHLWKTKGE